MTFVRVRSGVKSPVGRDLCLVYGWGETTGSKDHLDSSPDRSAVVREGSPLILHPAGLICVPRENLRGDRAQGHGQLCSGLPGSPTLQNEQPCKWMQRSPHRQEEWGGGSPTSAV